ncbi:hypothetical protein OIV83_003222 [Microbotryomycetes sp. JL201]|nr:hypothetical protein OIV83_003222 [Microbotryomycetes sp. JL201]
MSRSVALAVLVVLTWLSNVAEAYIPAVATNDSSALESDSSDRLTIAFYNGVYSTFISKQLDRWEFDDNGNYTNQSSIVPWTKFSKGVLLHFDESLRLEQPSAVPWIAMINCDTNGTSYDDELDIFTITRDLGAQAALLYSVTSAGCVMNQEYLDVYEKVLDVYATTTVSSARIIEQQFDNIGISDEAYSFDSARLNSSADAISLLLNSNALSVVGNVPVNGTMSDADDGQVSVVETASEVAATMDTLVETGDEASATSTLEPTAMPGNSTSDAVQTEEDEVVSPTPAPSRTRSMQRRQAVASSSTRSSIASSATAGLNFLGAVMAARNNTVGGLNPSATPTPSASSSGGGGSSNTGLAMIILYAITGVVTFMFMLVILSGAIRAIRHPERYGPRPGGGPNGNGIDGAGPRQTRAHGLTRAILDTFPVVRFGTRAQDSEAQNQQMHDDVEAANKAIELEAYDRAHNQLMSTTAPALDSLERRVSDSTRSRADTFVSARELPIADSVVAPNQSQADSPSTTSALPLTINPADVDDGTTCPICVCEFEEGEEIRILPCDARHRFHCECIDPWLLDVSSLCPLCRLDLSGAGNNNTVDAGVTVTQSRDSRDGQEDDETDEHAEAQVRSNLRAMLHGSRLRALSSSTGSGPGAGRNEVGAGVSRMRFFRYVANRRRQQQDPNVDESAARRRRSSDSTRA